MRRILTIGGFRYLSCKCDASSLTTRLPAPTRKSFCHLCGIRKPTPVALTAAKL